MSFTWTNLGKDCPQFFRVLLSAGEIDVTTLNVSAN